MVVEIHEAYKMKEIACKNRELKNKNAPPKRISTHCDMLDGRPTTVHISLPKLPSQHYGPFAVLSSKKYEVLLNP